MKHIKLFESYFQGDDEDDYTSNDKYEIAKEFAQEYNDEYEYIVFEDGKPVHGWEYLQDAVIDGVLESSYGYSQSEIDEETEMLLDDVLEFDNADFEDFDASLWEEFEEKLLAFIEDMNAKADGDDYKHTIQIVKV